MTEEKKHVMKILLIKSEIRIMIINLIFDANIRVANSVRMIIFSCFVHIHCQAQPLLSSAI